MKSIEEYNAEKQKDLLASMPKFPRPNGIKCPKCGEELFDIDDRVLLSHPPKKNVKCLKCLYQTYSIY